MGSGGTRLLFSSIESMILLFEIVSIVFCNITLLFKGTTSSSLEGELRLALKSGYFPLELRSKMS